MTDSRRVRAFCPRFVAAPSAERHRLLPHGVSRHPRHLSWVNRPIRVFGAGVGDLAIVSVQNPVRLDVRNELRPDIALLRYREDFYRAAHPGPGEVLLIVEVAETSHGYGRDIKLPRYARHGIPEVWIVDLGQRQVTVHRQPEGSGERESLVLAGQQTLAPVALPERRVTFDGWF